MHHNTRLARRTESRTPVNIGGQPTTATLASPHRLRYVPAAMDKNRIALISTGGTIEKTYDELSGVLQNRMSVLDLMLATMELRGVEIRRVQLMNKDSLDMSDDDHDLIAQTAEALARANDGVVITHGTDRLAATGERIVAYCGTPQAPIILTGAMRPYTLRTTDAVQNLTEALLAAQLATPGVYAVMHNRVLQFPGVVKDVNLGTFVKPAPSADST